MKKVELFQDLKSSFCDLWSKKSRGETLEIITPFCTINNKFISIFLKIQENQYILSDGGWVHEDLYDTGLINYKEFQQDFGFTHLQTSLNINSLKYNNKIFYYVICDYSEDISSKAFDLASFIQGIINLWCIKLASNESKPKVDRFNYKVKNYLLTLDSRGKFRFNSSLPDDMSPLKFHAIHLGSQNKFNIIQYIFGSDKATMNSSIAKTAVSFTLAEEKGSSKIRNKIAIIDSNSLGFDYNNQKIFIDHLKSTTSKVVEWKDRINIQEYLV